MFDDVASRYDLTNDVLSLGQDRRWRRAVVEAVAASPGERVLDLAAGTGTSSAPFAERGSFVVLWRPAKGRRVGFAVSRQLRGAARRNRARRRIREAYRQVREQMAPDIEMVVVARPSAATRPFPELIDDMRRLAEALGRPGSRA